MLKRICFFWITLTLLLFCNISIYAYTAHTRDEAVHWAWAQSGKSIDVDGNGYHCVDLILVYYDYFSILILNN